MRRGRLIDRGPDRGAGSGRRAASPARRRLLRIEVAGAPEGGPTRCPAWRLESEVAGGVVLLLDDGVDEQRVLDLARASGDVTHFSRVRPGLAELFREVVGA